jgi:ELWxxDGT repeat protein
VTAARASLAALAGALAVSGCLATGASGAAVNVTPSLVKDVNAPPSPSGSRIGDFTQAGGTVFFIAEDGGDPSVHGLELWKTDGTTAGTAMVEDINPGEATSDPASLTVVDGILYFAADDGVHGRELWRSDGTPAGTEMVEDINPGDDENPGTPDSSSPNVLTAIGGDLYFQASEGPEPTGSGVEFWKSTDGTAAGTELVEDINPNGDSSPGNWKAALGTVFFSADDGTNGNELWTTDGSAAGTDMLVDKAPGAQNFFPYDLTVIGDRILMGGQVGGDAELYATDGTAAGTTLVKDIRVGSSSSPYQLTELNGAVVFGATAEAGRELYRSDGTADGTVRLADIRPGPADSNPLDFQKLGGAILMQAEDGVHGNELWRTDGTTAGTTLVKDINPGPVSSGLIRLTRVGDTVLFTAASDTSDFEVWKTDGTAANTEQATNINPTGGSFPEDYFDFNGTALFHAFEEEHGDELWKATITPVPGPKVDQPAPPPRKRKKCKRKKGKRSAEPAAKPCKKKKKG